MPDIEYHQTIQYFSPKLVRGVRVGRPDFESVKLLSRTIQIQQA
jgi:hypothetical protein